MGAVVITGASAGIGAATARAFAKLGRPLVLGARRMDRLEQIARECEQLGSPKALPVQLDVRDFASIQAFAKAADPLVPDVVLNNAGLAKGRDPVAQLPDEALTEMIDVNVTGAVRVARAFLPGLVARKSGHLVNLSSIAALQVYEGGGVYCATKFALRAISSTLRLELVGSNVRITDIMPGMVETEFSKVRLGDEQKAKAVYAGLTPLTAEDIAETIVWAVDRPPHVHIHEILLTCTDQASVTKAHRRT